MYQIDFFKNLTDLVEYKAGDKIFSKGDESNATLYAVREGTVDIVNNGVVINSIGPKEFFGEMALIDSSVRSADAIARTDCKIAYVDRTKFLFLVHETPTFALQVMHIMAERIRKMMI